MIAKPLRPGSLVLLPAALLLVALLPAPGAGSVEVTASRGSSLGSGFRISASKAGEDLPAVAHNSHANEYLVVWRDTRNWGTSNNDDIYGQRLAADGTRLGPNIRIAGRTTGDSEPAVVYNPDANEYFVVWTNGRNMSTTGYDVYGRRIAADGTLLASGIRITSDPGTDADDTAPAVAYNSAEQQYLVVYEYGRDWESLGTFIHGQLVDPNGSLDGGDFSVGWTYTDYWASLDPAVAYHPEANQYLVVWEGGEESSSCRQIWGQHLTASGGVVGVNFTVTNSSAGFCASDPSVAPISGSGYVVVWEDTRPTVTGRGIDIRARRLGADGSTLGSSYRISGLNARGDETHPRLAYDTAAHTYLVVWADTRNAASRGADIYGKRLTTGALPTGSDFRVGGTGFTTNEYRPEAAYNTTDDEYLVVFTTNRYLATRGWDIFGQRVAG